MSSLGFPYTVLRSYPFYRAKAGALRLGINDNPERVILVLSCHLLYSIASPWSVMLLLAISRLKSNSFLWTFYSQDPMLGRGQLLALGFQDFLAEVGLEGPRQIARL